MAANIRPGTTSFNNPNPRTALGTDIGADNLKRFQKLTGGKATTDDVSKYYGQTIKPNDQVRGQIWNEWKRDHLRYVMKNDPGFLADDANAKYRTSYDLLNSGRLANKGNPWEHVAMSKDPISDFNERYNEWRVKNGAKPVSFNKTHIGFDEGGDVQGYNHGGMHYNHGGMHHFANGGGMPTPPPGVPPPPPEATAAAQGQSQGQGGMPPPGGPQGGPPSTPPAWWTTPPPWMDQMMKMQQGPQGGPPPGMQGGPPPRGGPGMPPPPPRGGMRPPGYAKGGLVGVKSGLGGISINKNDNGAKNDGIAKRGHTKCKIV